ncbi:MAG: hypothetical protein B7Y97_08370 [Sphingomonas sp. 32-66-10]|nr:MAG: hypothetical protein B7Y97_08370 [Sphingomonas sp. 32-66-10]
MFSTLFRTAALGAVLLLSHPAAATPGKSVTVRHADLDLTAVAGRQTLERRIAHAAMSVCGGRPDYRNLTETRAHNRCVASALESARPSIELAVRSAATRQLAARDQNVRVAP